MDRKRIERILEQVGRGNMTVGAAMEQLRLAPLEKLGFATIDLHRATRRGFPEVIYGPGKTTEEIVEIARRMHAAGQNVLITRVDPDVHSALAKIATGAVHHPLARAVTLAASTSGKDKADKPRPGITVMTAGTSDRPVAEEAAVTAETMGNEVQRIFDVGVAGIHRLFEHQKAMVRSRVIVVVAGMEGALPSIVAGLTDCPVIGVPTSTGYGIGGQGEAALLAMLNSCAGGLTVVNVDNGFGAGYAAALVNRAQRAAGKPHT